MAVTIRWQGPELSAQATEQLKRLAGIRASAKPDGTDMLINVAEVAGSTCHVTIFVRRPQDPGHFRGFDAPSWPVDGKDATAFEKDLQSFAAMVEVDRQMNALHTAPHTVPPVETPPFAGVGRNDPCPCGSGKKFKHCHLS